MIRSYLNPNKIDRVTNNHLSSCSQLTLENIIIYESINKGSCSQILVMHTRQTINPMTLKFLLAHNFIRSLPERKFKIERMVNN